MRQTVAEAVADLRPAFARDPRGHEVWVIRPESLAEATREARLNANRVCGDEKDGATIVSGCTVQVERTDASISVRTVGCSCLDEEGDPPRLTMTVTAADIGASPRNTEPVSAFDPVSRFILKVNQCKSLPWEYTNFAAADTYTPPDDPDYLGPTPLVSHYVCEHEVSPARREEARRK